MLSAYVALAGVAPPVRGGLFVRCPRRSGVSPPSSRELADWLAKDGQLLIPLVELLEKGRAGH